jgi:hypothetical protein
MTIGFNWYYTRLYVITLVILYLFHFSEVLRPISLVNPESGYESLYANIGLVIYLLYLAKKFYTHATGVRNSIGATPTSEDSSSAQINRNAKTRKSKSINKTRYLSYYLTYAIFLFAESFYLFFYHNTNNIASSYQIFQSIKTFLYFVLEFYFFEKFDRNLLHMISITFY